MHHNILYLNGLEDYLKQGVNLVKLLKISQGK